jgi:hypothetical protein
VVLLEAALTLPVICYLIFFLLELMKINITQTSIETITAECTFEFIATGNNKNFGTIIEKYRPKFIPLDRIRYWIRLYVGGTVGTTAYEGLAYMCLHSPYGGEEIYWPLNNTVGGSFGDDDHFGGFNADTDYLDTDGSNSILAAVNYLGTSTYNSTSEVEAKKTEAANYIIGNPNAPSGTAFVLTFVVDYNFSSAFVRMLFSGGSNTKRGAGKGKKYLLWGRGVGIVNDTTPPAAPENPA